MFIKLSFQGKLMKFVDLSLASRSCFSLFTNFKSLDWIVRISAFPNEISFFQLPTTCKGSQMAFQGERKSFSLGVWANSFQHLLVHWMAQVRISKVLGLASEINLKYRRCWWASFSSSRSRSNYAQRRGRGCIAQSSILASYPMATVLILGVTKNFSLDIAEIHWWHSLELWTEVW